VKQRENLGIAGHASTATNVPAVKKTKDKTQAELDEINKQLKKDKNFNNYKVESRKVKKALNI